MFKLSTFHNKRRKWAFAQVVNDIFHQLFENSVEQSKVKTKEIVTGLFIYLILKTE